MWFLRISWTDKVSNEVVLERAGMKRKLMKVTRKRQLQFLGHVMRCEGMENLMLTGKIEIKKSKGRQKQKFITSLNKDLQLKKSDCELLALSKERKKWNAMISNVLKGYVT